MEKEGVNKGEAQSEWKRIRVELKVKGGEGGE